MEGLPLKQSIKKTLSESSLADKLTFLSFIGTIVTCLYSAIMFLPNLENRVVEVENQLKILPEEIEKLRLDAVHLQEAVKNSHDLSSELENIKRDNNYLKGKVETLEKIVTK